MNSKETLHGDTLKVLDGDKSRLQYCDSCIRAGARTWPGQRPTVYVAITSQSQPPVDWHGVETMTLTLISARRTNNAA